MKDQDHEEWLENEKIRKAAQPSNDDGKPQKPTTGDGDGERAAKRVEAEAKERESNRWWNGLNP